VGSLMLIVEENVVEPHTNYDHRLLAFSCSHVMQ